MVLDQVVHHLALRKRGRSPGHVVIGKRAIRQEGAGIPTSFCRLVYDLASFVSAQAKMVRKKRRHVQLRQIVEGLLGISASLGGKTVHGIDVDDQPPVL